LPSGLTLNPNFPASLSGNLQQLDQLLVFVGPHPSGTVTITVSSSGYQPQTIRVFVPANSFYSPYNFSRGFPQEFSSLTATERSYAAQIANSLYETISTPYTATVNGITRTWYGLGRRADVSGIAFWAKFCTNSGITPSSRQFLNAFFTTVESQGNSTDFQAARSNSKSFNSGTGYDKFIDRP
jgi:hypothetical protein